MNSTIKVLIIAIIIIGAIYFISSLNSTQIDTFVQSEHTPPLKNAYKPFLKAPDNRYVYYPDENIYLLPYDYLDFNDPYDLWAYYWYPGYYSSYYPNYYPFVGGYGGNYGNYGGFIYDANVSRNGGKGHRTISGIHDRSGRGIHSIIHPNGHPGSHSGSGGHSGSTGHTGFAGHSSGGRGH